MSRFGDRLRNLRIAKNMTQQDLADKLCLNKQTISQYERGVRQPQIEVLETLADIFNVDMNYLLGKEDLITRLINTEEYSLLEKHRCAAAQDDLVLREDELELLRMYNNISESHQKDLLAAARVFETSDNLQSGVSDLSGDGDILDDKESEDGIA